MFLKRSLVARRNACRHYLCHAWVEQSMIDLRLEPAANFFVPNHISLLFVVLYSLAIKYLFIYNRTLYNDPVPDSYFLHAFVIENAYQAAASREPKSGSLYRPK